MKKDKKVSRTYILVPLFIAITVVALFSANIVLAGNKVKLSSKKLTLTVGDYKTVSLNGAGKNVKWNIKSGKSIIALKDAKAQSVKVYGKKEGKAKLQAKYKGKKYICTVDVDARENGQEAQQTEEPQDTVGPGGEDGEKLVKDSKEWKAVTGFGTKLFTDVFQESGDKNVMISPVSVFNALTMTANGAKGETLEQFESAFGIPLDKCNSYLKSYNNSLPCGDKYKLSTANSIWLRDNGNFKVEQDFLDRNKEYSGAGVYPSAFDAGTVNDINSWVNKNTDGMIPSIVDNIPADAQMYLINALAFDAEWKEIYDEYAINKDTFTKEDGSVQDADMMYSEERTYLEDKNTTGFVKYYADSRYAFVALLPKKGVSMEDYVKALDGERIKSLLNNKTDIKVNAAIPKFESDFSINLGKTLQDMGITRAFDSSSADFTGIGKLLDGNLYVSDVLHKTYIAVDEKGTKAGAVTSVLVAGCAAVIEPEEEKTVHLDRPFVYMIVDCDSWLPAFLGVVQEI